MNEARRFRRIVTRWLIALGMGMAATVALSVLLYVTVDSRTGRVELGETVLEPGQSWWFRAHYGFASSRFESWLGPSDPATAGLPTADIPAPSWRKLNRTPGPDSARQLRVVELWGWPIRALWREGAPDDRSITALPWRPFWPGFAVDSLIYGAAVWAVIHLGSRRASRQSSSVA